jgi:PAS domain S-box-containing protein
MVEPNQNTGSRWFRGGTSPLATLRNSRKTLRGRLMLVVMLTTAIALSVAGAGLLLTDLRDSRQTWAADLETEANILALATAPALSFDDRKTAERNLSALQARRSIRAAALYTADGSLYAQYARDTEAALPADQRGIPAGLRIAGGHIELLQPVVQNGETLGTIYLTAEYDLSDRIQAYAGVLALVLVFSFAIALTLSSWLQRRITHPVDAMADVARNVVGQRDYSLRASKTSDDELGVLVDAFNSMLGEIESRTLALEQANSAIRQSENLYRGIGESIEYGVWICDAEGRNLYASDSFLRLIGLTQEECSDFRWGERLHPEDRERTISAWKECVRTGHPWYREHRVLGVDGIYHPILAQGVAIRDEKGNITRWAGINLDIARMKRTELALRDADRRKDEFLATLAHELRNPLAPIRNAVRILDLPTADDRQRRWGRDVIQRQVTNMALLLDDLLDVSRITRGQLELKKDFVELHAVVDMAVETARPLIESKQHTLITQLPPEKITLEVDPLRVSQVLGNLLTNAAKYTDPGGEITLKAGFSEGALVISVRDTGIGLSAESIPGLFTMFSQVNSAIDRAEGGLGIGLGLVKGLVTLHGGSVEARSEGLGRGSEFTVYLPPATIVASSKRSSASAGHTVVNVRERGTVLIADDNQDAAESLALLLELAGYQVARAYSGHEALETAVRVRPDAILLDIGMPGLDGYEVARRVRLEAWGQRAVLIAITGWGQADDKRKAQAAGFDEHLTKPVDPMELERMLIRLLADHPDSTGAHQDTRPL